MGTRFEAEKKKTCWFDFFFFPLEGGKGFFVLPSLFLFFEGLLGSVNSVIPKGRSPTRRGARKKFAPGWEGGRPPWGGRAQFSGGARGGDETGKGVYGPRQGAGV